MACDLRFASDALCDAEPYAPSKAMCPFALTQTVLRFTP